MLWEEFMFTIKCDPGVILYVDIFTQQEPNRGLGNIITTEENKHEYIITTDLDKGNEIVSHVEVNLAEQSLLETYIVKESNFHDGKGMIICDSNYMCIYCILQQNTDSCSKPPPVLL